MRRSIYTKQISFKVTPLLFSELSAEAWESKMELDDYVRGLLSSRGKWKRTVGQPGGYLLGPTEKRR